MRIRFPDAIGQAAGPSGIDLLDYFAAQAITRAISVVDAYDIALSMLEARRTAHEKIKESIRAADAAETAKAEGK